MNNVRKLQFALIFSLAALLLTACGGQTTTPTPNDQSQIPAGKASGGGVIVEGRITPAESSSLFFPIPGRVAEVLVKEGDIVKAGTVLARLGDTEQIKANLASAKLELVAAQQSLDALQRTPSLAYNQAVQADIIAETAYYAALTEWNDFDEDKYNDDLDAAVADVSTAKSELQDAQDEFAKYASLKEGNSDRKRAKDDLDSAQKKYDDAVAAQADLENEYRQLKSSLDLAQAQWDETRRTLELRQDGPDKDQLALAQIRLEAATARVAAADKALSDLELVAPYNGTVAKLDISEGERVVPNQPVATFADFSKWYVETTDLTENEVVDVKEGQHVVIIPDALSDLELNGVVENISQAYSEKAGDIVYKARILLSDDDPRLRWGLTVETRFLNEE